MIALKPSPNFRTRVEKIVRHVDAAEQTRLDALRPGRGRQGTFNSSLMYRKCRKGHTDLVLYGGCVRCRVCARATQARYRKRQDDIRKSKRADDSS